LPAATAALARLEGTCLASFFRSVPATVWMTDSKMTLTFLQGPLLERLQIEPEQVLGKTLPDLLLEGREDHPLIQGHITALAGHEAAVRIEWGSTLYHARVAPLRDVTGAIVGCVGVHQAIGWMPDDEGTLRENDIRLRRVVDSNIIGIAFGDDSGRITDANDAFLELAGYTREDLTADGISWPALTAIESHQRQMRALEEIREIGRCAPFEIELIRRDGERVPVLVGAARIAAERREGVAFVLDISDRKRILRRLEGELACADALAAAPTVALALPKVLGTLTCELGWRAAAVWLNDDEGGIRLAETNGVDGDAGKLRTLGERAARAEEPMWASEAEVYAAPLIHEGVKLGALVCIGRKNRCLDDALLATCRRIVGRIARKASNRT
jgi:PAS domain S-box-containing protein